MRIISTPDKGRGVFASQPIKIGEVVEISPVLLFTKEEYTQHGQHTALDDYTFVWPDRSGRMGLAMGIGSMFNHHKQPNVSYSINTHTLTITFKTTRHININDELCISYGPESKLWWRNTQVDDDEDDQVKDMSELDLLQCDYGS
ncbi:hypothetical protein E3P92_00367 [Wallemia ichthyophaga]|uniref:SET domain-containing protein n=2 Tax=Wallemia ichthyophaga TaxID=245174 RepID=A0A4T0GT66_WALIC|nr:SET domain-containing protein 7 [Wallemia ichthyophaga EXF-994]TIA74862.1 hypothetical protein E3P91_00723 [Wallemia ichthyophaga]EOR00933.1 SET domain-containing protein 7 [Wallemia ichthyophaga EXF-994]TIA81683.1 hypothetical protein E3P98_01903 [Wallemia ichthyophaga]TIA94082.1 hypothetical protein E3P97_00329 [Wallemia ichthyophaga]TIB03812.1 hypothetical protein E3P95_00432 [Wallemia ichthyophaga]